MSHYGARPDAFNNRPALIVIGFLTIAGIVIGPIAVAKVLRGGRLPGGQWAVTGFGLGLGMTIWQAFTVVTICACCGLPTVMQATM